MSDLFNRITENQNVIRKLLSKIPGFNGYIERENRRASDKLLRKQLPIDLSNNGNEYLLFKPN